MNDAPYHYDGSVQSKEKYEQPEEVVIPKDISRHLSGNPYVNQEDDSL
ncbi:hypothetical protein JF544_01130 [Halobacillus kuroshimensis]|uniref:Uncharacterized protein n=1 Tax=Halobacillus kuroshimensis TaxID=302481 RepID=A0ABS3DR65_9BACI|nr:hypothetical protein [Halobacillus kuroshimensis]MBN8233824.1 hypothetical protein [Halobacillus kuroshimensis]